LPSVKEVFDELDHSMMKNESFPQSQRIPKLAKTTTVDSWKYDVQWIEENGVCIEKIRPYPSTIEGAGLGAFAQMSIAMGDIISPAPLLNIPNKDSLLMYKTRVKEDGTRVKVDDDPIGHQLLLNYCFGHEKSPLLLCPETNTILINHCSNRLEGKKFCNGNSPNAKIQWATSSGWDNTTKDWLNKSIEDITELTASSSRGLSLEVVATRDIFPGEEIFIDYGINWEKAWDRHVKNWKPPTDSTYVPLADVTKRIRSFDNFPDNLELSCCLGKLTQEKYDDEENSDDQSKSMEDTELDGKTGFSCTRDELLDPTKLSPCEIVEYSHGISSDGKSNLPTVRIFYEKRRFLVKNYRRESITITMKKYSSDQHLPGAFRHFIEIDDDIFPEHWKIL